MKNSIVITEKADGSKGSSPMKFELEVNSVGDDTFLSVVNFAKVPPKRVKKTEFICDLPYNSSHESNLKCEIMASSFACIICSKLSKFHNAVLFLVYHISLFSS